MKRLSTVFGTSLRLENRWKTCNWPSIIMRMAVRVRGGQCFIFSWQKETSSENKSIPAYVCVEMNTSQRNKIFLHTCAWGGQYFTKKQDIPAYVCVRWSILHKETRYSCIRVREVVNTSQRHKLFLHTCAWGGQYFTKKQDIPAYVCVRWSTLHFQLVKFAGPATPYITRMELPVLSSRLLT